MLFYVVVCRQVNRKGLIVEYQLNSKTKTALRPALLKVWKLNKKIANLQAERNIIIDDLVKQYGKAIIDKAYSEFSTGTF